MLTQYDERLCGCVVYTQRKCEKEDINRAMCKDREVRFEIFNERKENAHAYQPLPSNSVLFLGGEGKSFLL